MERCDYMEIFSYLRSVPEPITDIPRLQEVSTVLLKRSLVILQDTVPSPSIHVFFFLWGYWDIWKGSGPHEFFFCILWVITEAATKCLCNGAYLLLGFWLNEIHNCGKCGIFFYCYFRLGSCIGWLFLNFFHLLYLQQWRGLVFVDLMMF